MRSARRWYEQRREGLGDAFLDEIERVLARIEAAPGQFPVVHREVRRALARRFPHAVFFRVDPREIIVLAVLHQARAPGTAARRK
ncbi:MAG: type II toxin-antitoxin system RelE/ParE family toxin [Myxococcota bacterium]|nr:type II toxin-antitoxin system RelE/ParE family toxin [Myxococcota bacterium]